LGKSKRSGIPKREVNTNFRFLSSAVTEKYLFIVARNVLSRHHNFQVYDKSSGSLTNEGDVNGGSYGGVLPPKNGIVMPVRAAVMACVSFS